MFFSNVAKPPSSPIQTLLSALELHQILPKKQAHGLREYFLITVDREFHPAPKIDRINFYNLIILEVSILVKKFASKIFVIILHFHYLDKITAIYYKAYPM